MARRDLKASWGVTRRHLADARAALGRPTVSHAHAALAECDEFLAHNELALAMEALADAADDATPAHFWAALADAALNMGESERASGYRARVC